MELRVTVWLFEHVIYLHIVVGAFGLVAFWVPIIGRKGGVAHRRWGRWFAWAMLTNGVLAGILASLTIYDPVPTHHRLNITDPAMIRGVFGWMMLYLGILTASLAWHSLVVVRNKRDHAANRAPFNVFMQLLCIATAANSAVQGLLIGQPLMIAMAPVGLIAATTNLWFIYKNAPPRLDYVVEHFKGGVGAGISVYTAFLAFGAVRLAPEHALNPIAWSVPCLIGLSIIFWHAHRYRYFERFMPWRRPAAG